jgi:hypothetical protein
LDAATSDRLKIGLDSQKVVLLGAAIEVVTHELAVMVGARSVSFLIADFSGHAVVRFGRAEPMGADRLGVCTTAGEPVSPTTTPWAAKPVRSSTRTAAGTISGAMIS